jgi:hypothetical protein
VRLCWPRHDPLRIEYDVLLSSPAWTCVLGGQARQRSRQLGKNFAHHHPHQIRAFTYSQHVNGILLWQETCMTLSKGSAHRFHVTFWGCIDDA